MGNNFRISINNYLDHTEQNQLRVDIYSRYLKYVNAKYIINILQLFKII